MKILIFLLISFNCSAQYFYAPNTIIGIGASTIPNLLAPIPISGNNIVGNTISVISGSWTNSPLSYTYQVQKNGIDIPGETTTNYTILIGDISQAIRWKVTAINTIGFGIGYSNSVGPLPIPLDNLVTRDGSLLTTRTTIQLTTR